MTNTQKLERLKEIEKEFIKQRRIILETNKIIQNITLKCKNNPLKRTNQIGRAGLFEKHECANCFYESRFWDINRIEGRYIIKKLKQEANKIGEEFKNGCGKTISGTNEDGTYIQMNCGDFNYFCPTCQEAKEILARINNE